MTIRFLLDENQPRWLVAAVRRREPRIDILRVGDPDAPPLETPDPDILHYAEGAQRLLITSDLRSMPGHVIAHRAAEGHHWGVCYVRPGTSRRTLIEELLLLWHASEAEEWVDRLDWLPL